MKYINALLLNPMSSIDMYLIEMVILFNISYTQVGWNSTLRKEFQTNVYDDDVRNKLVSAHVIVTSNILAVTDENHDRCIFPTLPVNVLRSYYIQNMYKNNIFKTKKKNKIKTKTLLPCILFLIFLWLTFMGGFFWWNRGDRLFQFLYTWRY